MVRLTDAGALPTFLAFEPDPDRAADQEAYLERLLTISSMRSDWFTWPSELRVPVGRFAFWTIAHD